MYFTTSWKLEGFEQGEAEGSIPSLRFHGRVGLAELELQMRTLEKVLQLVGLVGSWARPGGGQEGLTRPRFRVRPGFPPGCDWCSPASLRPDS